MLCDGMDATYFLKSRTAFIRAFYGTGAQSFDSVKRRIEDGHPPFDNPPYSEDPEPAYLEEWMDAEASVEVLGLASISMLSDSLKLYLNTLAERVIGFSFKNPKVAFRYGFLPAYFDALGEILATDWSDCPVDRALIEQIVLVRNRGQHGGDLTSFTVTHDRSMMEKHPRPFFVSDGELSMLTSEDGSLGSLLLPTVRVSAAGLERAIQEVDALADWIDGRMDRAHDWRARQNERAAAERESELGQ